MIEECWVCGCSDLNPCVDGETLEACAWIAPGLCSFCEFAPLGFYPPERFERVPNFAGIMLA